MKPSLVSESLPTLQPPDHKAQLLESCEGGEVGTHSSHLPLGRGARGLCRQQEEEIQEGEGSRSRFVGNQSSRGQRADVRVVMGMC